jgi:hypothetical protein
VTLAAASLPRLPRDATVLPRCQRRATMISFTGLKVFSTTLARDREGMGEQISRWITGNPDLEVVDRDVRQSSDKEFHCLTITLFYRERKKA